MDDKMVEYYKQVAELQNLAREREQQRLALEREAIQRLQMREKRREDIWKKVKKLRCELVDDELKSSQRIRVLQARVDALSHEQKLLAMHTEKLRIKKRHYELLLFANYSKLQDVPPHVTQHLSNVRYDWSPLDDSKRVHFATTAPSTPYAEDKDQAIITPSLFSAAQAFSSVSAVPPFLPSSYLYSTLPSQMSTSATYTFANTQSRDVTNGMSRSNTAHELRVPDSLESLQHREDQTEMGTEVHLQGTVRNKEMQRTSGAHPTSLVSGDIQSSKEHTAVSVDGISHVGMPRMPSATGHVEELLQRMPVTSQRHSEQEQREVITQKNEILQRYSGEMDIGMAQGSKDNNDKSMSIQSLQSPFARTPSSGNQLLVQPQHSVDGTREKEPPDEIDFIHSATYMNNKGITGQGYESVVSKESNPSRVLPSSNWMTATDNTQVLPSQASSSAQQSSMIETPDEKAMELKNSASNVPSNSLNTSIASHVFIEGAVASNNEDQEFSHLPPQRTVNEISSSASGYSSLNVVLHHTGVPDSASVTTSTSGIDKNPVPSASEDQSYLIHETNASHSPLQSGVEGAQEETKLETYRETKLPSQSQMELQNCSSQQHKSEEAALPVRDQTAALPIEMMVGAKTESPLHSLSQPCKAQQHSDEVETVKGQVDVNPEYSKPMEDVDSTASEDKTSTQSIDSQVKHESHPDGSSPNGKILRQESITSIKEPESIHQSPKKGFDPPPVKAVSKAPFIIKMSEDEDDDFFDKKVPVTESAAYRSLLGSASAGILESDSDELEAQMASLIAKPQEKSKLKPFSAVASLHSAHIPTDSDSVDSVEAAIQAATQKDAASTVSSSLDKKPGFAPTTAISKQDSTKEIKSKSSSALQIRLESDSESYDVSGGGGGSDQDDDFDFD